MSYNDEVIAAILPEAYDAEGRKVFRAHERSKRKFTPTFPIGRFFSHPLQKQYADFEELRRFFLGCKAKSDEELFGQREYWQPPEEFEKRREGDCEDFAIYAWRQLIGMGYRARLAGGAAGRYGDGHAWVQFQENGKWFLLEPQYRVIGLRLPQLTTLTYKPDVSFEWDGEKAHHFAHDPARNPPIERVLALVPEWLSIWSRVWARVLLGVVLFPVRWIRRQVRSTK